MRMRFCSVLVSLARRGTLLLILPCVFSKSLISQISAASPQNPSSYVLTGTVINSSTGAPIPYALVQVGQESKLADQNGNFRFEDLSSNNAYVSAHKPGFFEEREISDFPVAMSTVALSDKPTSLMVRLIPEAVIAGHIEDSEGEPIENLPVRLRHAQIVNGRRMWQMQHGASTDEDGNFRIANIKPGTYYVAVGPNFRGRRMFGMPNPDQKMDVFPAEYYPGVRDLSAAAPLRLTAGQHAVVDMGLKKVPAYSIGGVITGTTTNSGGVTLVDADGDNVNVGVRFDSQTGRFEAFPVPAGSYRLRFNGQDADGQALFADVPLNVNGSVGELRVPAHRAISIPVEFETEFTKPSQSQPQAGIANVGKMPAFYGQLRLTSRKPPYQQFFSGREKPDSPMVIHGLEPGTYDVEVDSNGASYVASVTYAGIDLLNQPLAIAEGADEQPIEVVLRDDGASVNGVVQSPDGTPSAQVLMISEGDAGNPPRPVFVDASGTFHAQSLAPGDYDILAFDRLDGIEYRNRGVLNAYLGHAAHVTLSPDEQAKVTVDLIRTQQ
jgi:protocatechuate 3,4-dioxygenase beta subunit